jgi:hypothetical protein
MSVTKAGEVYRHYKGNLYLVLHVADYTGENPMEQESKPTWSDKNVPVGFFEGTRLIVYVGLYNNPKGNRPCVRSEAEWNERVQWECTAQDVNRAKGEHGPRYILVVK